MAIFGNLNHMSLGDLLPLLSVQDGALEVFNLENHPRVTLYFRGGLLQCLFVAGRPADSLVARSIVTLLMGSTRGSFEFVPGAPERHCPHLLDWPLDRLLITVVSVQDEMQELERRLPHPDTIFRMIRDEMPEDRRLADFWKRAQERLDAGASAQELASRMGMPLEHAQYYLFKLRQAGLVMPVRARAQRRSMGSSVAARLIDSLKQRFFGGRQAWNH